MHDQPGNRASPTSCHTRGCALPAVYTCDRCGHLCCADHVRHQTIERRVYRDETEYQPVLERASSHFESYTFCSRCSTKPFNGKPAQQPM
jgi:hypothetical protein